MELPGRHESTRVPEAGRSPRREYCEAVLAEEPPVTPREPYTPQPPAWMDAPVVVFDMSGTPVEWVDEWPLRDYEHRLGQALYELRLEDMRDQLRAEGDAEQSPGNEWARKQERQREKLIASRMQEAINHRAALLSVAERQERGLTAPWNRKPPVSLEKELPEAECYYADWWWERR
ncbi:hypothetical protein VR44_06490 [Streptomyces katrae]|uniref:Uncharacterized protein n=1 Tax=Streptomyces katrae TaxID=68223 RepID=A0A0F4JTD4_9ACTN|nr:hypothetical protein VR44_06490 [Streptomyces katrae]